MSTTTTKQVWDALPYFARRELIPAELAELDGMESVDLDVWTPERIQVTPWSLLPQPIREAVHAMVTCEEME